MKRHLLGFALFNLIVGTALLVAILTKSFPTPRTSYVYEVSKTSSPTIVRQNYGNSKNSIKITQAVLNEKTGKLNMSFAIQRETPMTQNIKVKLVFIDDLSKEQRNWDKIIGVDSIVLSPDFDINNKAIFSMASSYSWLRNLKDNKNLYVYLEEVEILDADSQSSFDLRYSESAPILVSDKK